MVVPLHETVATLVKNGKFLASRRNGISVVGAIGVTIDSNVSGGAEDP